MDYLYIVLSLLGFTAQFVLMQFYEKRVKQNLITGFSLAIITNSVGMLLFFMIGGFRIQITGFSLFMAIALAVVMILYNFVSLLVLSYGNLAVYSMFMMLGGMVLPFLYGIIFLGESITAGKAVGVVLLSFFMVLQSFSQKSNDKYDKKFLFLCFVIFVINGLTSVISKAHQEGADHINEPSFITLSCMFTVLISTVTFVIVGVKQKETLKAEIKLVFSRRALPLSCVLGVAMYGANFLLLLGARTVPASVQFPIVSGGVIVLSAIAGVVVFKNKMSKTEMIAVTGAFVSTICFAF